MHFQVLNKTVKVDLALLMNSWCGFGTGINTPYIYKLINPIDVLPSNANRKREMTSQTENHGSIDVPWFGDSVRNSVVEVGGRRRKIACRLLNSNQEYKEHQQKRGKKCQWQNSTLAEFSLVFKFFWGSISMLYVTGRDGDNKVNKRVIQCTKINIIHTS